MKFSLILLVAAVSAVHISKPKTTGTKKDYPQYVDEMVTKSTNEAAAQEALRNAGVSAQAKSDEWRKVWNPTA